MPAIITILTNSSKYVAIFCLVVILFGCSAEPTVAPEELPVVLTDEPEWVVIQVESIEILKSPKDLDQIDEFRFFMIAGDGTPLGTAEFVHLPMHNIAVRVGDTVPGSNFGLAVNAKALDGTLYVYFVGVDSDELDKASNIGIDLVISVITNGLGDALIATTGGLSEVAAFITEFLLGQTVDYIQEEDIVGDGIFVLQADTNWGVGEHQTAMSRNGSLRLIYRITRSEIGTSKTTAGGELPADYLLFADFALGKPWEGRWWLDNPGQVCTLNTNTGALNYRCENTTDKNTVATLHPNGQPGGATGIAITQQVIESGGKAKLITNWTCGDASTERAYHLGLGVDAVMAVEYYPQEGWRSVELGRLDVSADIPHKLRIERSGGGIDFFVDNQEIILITAPNLPACAAMRDWGIDFYVWPNGNIIAGTFDQVYVSYKDR